MQGRTLRWVQAALAVPEQRQIGIDDLVRFLHSRRYLEAGAQDLVCLDGALPRFPEALLIQRASPVDCAPACPCWTNAAASHLPLLCRRTISDHDRRHRTID